MYSNTTNAEVQEPTTREFITPQELATKLGINLMSLYNRIKRGHVPVVKMGRCYYIPKDYLVAKPLATKTKATAQ